MWLCGQCACKPTGKWDREPTALPLCNADLRKKNKHRRALCSLAGQHKEAESESKDNTSYCLIPSAFREIGLCSLKITTGLLQRAAGVAHIFLSKQKTLHSPGSVAECSGQRSNCYFQVALKVPSKWHHWDQGLWRILAPGSSHTSWEEIKALVQGGV